jgi:ribosomal protein L20A (L18A)
MAQKVYRVTGSYRTVHHDQPFSKEVVAKDEKAAKEHFFSLFGSRHGVPRRLIKFTACKEVAPDQVEDAVVRHTAGLKV